MYICVLVLVGCHGNRLSTYRRTLPVPRRLGSHKSRYCRVLFEYRALVSQFVTRWIRGTRKLASLQMFDCPLVSRPFKLLLESYRLQYFCCVSKSAHPGIEYLSLVQPTKKSRILDRGYPSLFVMVTSLTYAIHMDHVCYCSGPIVTALSRYPLSESTSSLAR